MATGRTARRDLILVGAGGLALETIELVRAINERRPTWHLRGLVDDDPRRHGERLARIPVLGPCEVVLEHPDADVVLCTARPGRNDTRRSLAARLDIEDARLPTLVHPAASLASTAVLGPGAIVMAGTVMTAAVTLGRHVVVMPNSVLTHHDQVDDHVTLASGVRLGGGVHVEQGAYLGAGAILREGLTVGAWALVGMGAVVTRDVPPGEVWAGVPARFRGRSRVPAEVPEVSR